MTLHTDAIARAVSAFLLERSSALGRSAPDADASIFESGLLDSLSLIDLVTAVEAAIGAEVDMLRFDPSEVGTAAELAQALNAAVD